jgi:hypothetical protein
LSSRWTIAVSTFTSSRRLASSARMRSCWLRKTPMWPVRVRSFRLHCHRPGINRLNNDRIGQQPSIDRIVTQHCRVFRQLCWSGHDQRTGDRLGCREAEQVRIRIDCRWLSLAPTYEHYRLFVSDVQFAGDLSDSAFYRGSRNVLQCRVARDQVSICRICSSAIPVRTTWLPKPCACIWSNVSRRIWRTAGMGHFHPSPPPRLNGRCPFS